MKRETQGDRLCQVIDRLVDVPGDIAKYDKIRAGGQLVMSPGLDYRRWREEWVFEGIYDPESEGLSPPGT